MIGFERCAVGDVSDERGVLDDIGQRHVGGVAAVAVGEQVRRLGRGPRTFDESADVGAAPRHPELRPPRHAVDVPAPLGLGEFGECPPVKDVGLLHRAVDREHPLIGLYARGLADAEHGPFDRRRLSRRQALRIDSQ
jgi:hypothetical protein